MKTSFFALTLILLFASVSALGQSMATFETEIPLYEREAFIGDVKVTFEGEKLRSLDRASLLSVIRKYLRPDAIRSFETLPPQIDADRLPTGISFDPGNLRLLLTISLDERRRETIDVMGEHTHRYDGEALKPAPLGGAVNYRIEQSYSNLKEERAFTGQADSFVNMNGVVLENQTLYQSNLENPWYRGDTRLVKDFQKDLVRVQAGDVYPQVQGFMSGRPIGGVNISRNFTLNPYRLPYPTANQSFSLQSRSLVKYFVNGTLIKSEYLPAGNYSARDTPLSNGMNTVVIEATDDLGQTKTFVFRTATSIELLNEGESRFDLSYGVPFLDRNFHRDYVEEDGKLASGYFQYGFSSDFSGSLYAQNQRRFTLGGTELLKATAIGNVGMGYAHSENPEKKGEALALRYQYIGQGKRWFETNSLSLRFEQRSKKFQTSVYDSVNAVKNAYAANYVLPLANAFTVSVGGNYGDMYDNSLENRYGYDTTLSLRFLERHNFSVFFGRNRDEFSKWNTIAYAFVTITFENSNDFVTAFHDKEQNVSRLSYLRDNQNRLYSPRTQASIDNSDTAQSGEADFVVPTPVADFGTRITARHLVAGNAYNGRGSVRMNSAFVFARDGDEWGFGMSRPVPSSFALFKPKENLKGQKIALKSTSPYTESETGLFNEITYSQLLPYQYREIQLDPTFLDEGRSLKKEKFVVYPTYKSAHLITLSDTGMIMLKGRLVKKDGSPWPLKVGRAGDKIFFTNREGEFFIDGIEAGNYDFSIEETTSKAKIAIPGESHGIKDLGTITLEEDE